MAANSIAKLAVILTGETSPLANALRAAVREVDNAAKGMGDAWSSGLDRMKAATDSWAAGMQNIISRSNPFAAFQGIQAGPAGKPNEAWTAGIAKLKEQQDRWAAGMARLTGEAKKMLPAVESVRHVTERYRMAAGGAEAAVLKLSQALTASRGNIAAIGNILLSGGATTGFVALGIAAAAAAFKLALVSDQLKVAAGARAGDTVAGQWQRVKDNLTAIAQILGRPFASGVQVATKALADSLGNIANTFMPAIIRHERELARLAEKRKAAAEAEKKAREDAITRELELFKRRDDVQRDLLNRAQSIRQSLRTPFEEFRDNVNEMQQLLGRGFLSVESVKRGMLKARADLIGGGKATEAKAFVPPPNNAADRFTSAGQSAVLAAQRNQQAAIDLEKAQLAEAKKHSELLAEIERLARKNKGVTLAPVGL